MDIQSMIVSAALSAGVDPNLALAVAEEESGFHPNAVSSAGAIGVMQLMPATAAALGVTDIYDVAQNIQAGVRLLSQLLAQFGDVREALAAYNWGAPRVASAIARWGSSWLSHAPGETQKYVSDILGSLGMLGQSASSTAGPQGSSPSESGVLTKLEAEVKQLTAAIPNSNVPAWVAYAGLGVAVIGLILAASE